MVTKYIEDANINLFEQMAEIIDDVLWISDLEKSKIEYISPAYERIWGSSCQSLYDHPMSFVDAIHIEDRDRIIAALANQKNSSYCEVYRIIRPDGEMRWIRDRSYPPIRIKDGTLCVMGLAQDITKQHKSELEVLASEARFRSIIQASPVPLALNNDALEITFLNPAFVRSYGYTCEDIPTLGDWWPKAYPDLEYRQWVADTWQSQLQTAKQTGDEFKAFEVSIVCKDGKTKAALVSAAPLSSEYRGDHLVVLYDITKLREAEKEREELRIQVIQSSKLASLGELAASIAHEINNPISIAEGAANQLNMFKDNPIKFASKVESIQRACIRISKIVGGLKRFSRSSEVLDLKKQSLSDIVREVLVLSSIRSNRDNTEVSCDIQCEAFIFVDEVSIEQVILNLINNAIDAVREREERWIKLFISQDEQFVIFRITDSGLGIPEPIHLKIFEPFFTTKPVGEGTGLGLSVCRGIIADHKATLELISNSPHTCFEIKFPKAE